MAEASTRLRPVESADLAVLRQWRNHPDVRRVMRNRHEITPEEHQTWFRLKSEDPDWTLLIFERDGASCGFVSFRRETDDCVEWGFYKAPGAPPGTGLALGHHALAYAFQRLGVQCIRGDVLDKNRISQRFHERLGFSVTGSFSLGDSRSDDTMICYRLTRDDWMNDKQRGPSE